MFIVISMFTRSKR